jgi:hypothetical protein
VNPGLLIVTVSVTRSGTDPAQPEGTCRPNTGRPRAAASAIVSGPRRLARPLFKDTEYDPLAGVGDDGGGSYESPQSVPSWSAAPAEFVTVNAGQLKSLASSGSSSSVTVVVISSLGGQEVVGICVGDAGGAKYH